MGWIAKKILEIKERRNSPERRYEKYEKRLKRCPALTFEDLNGTEEELNECERMIEEVRQRILREEEQRNCSSCTK